MDDLIDEIPDGATDKTPEDWTEKRDYTPPTPWGARKEPEEPRYLGLTATEFNLAFFAVLAVIAVAAFLFLGGVSAVKDFTADDDSAPPAANTRSGTPSDTVAAAEGGGETVSAVLDTFNPLSLMGTLGSATGAPSAGEGGGELKAALLDEGDLPAGFSSFGDMSFTLPVEGGSGTMAANMFASGDLESGEFGAMVMSAALEGPPGTLDQLGDFGELQDLSDEDFAEMEQSLGQLGIGFSDFRLLDASGLGDGGMGMHMAMDFAGLFDQFAIPGGEEPPFDSITFEMYAFASGERVYMVMVIWPGDGDPGVDGRALADVVNARAS